MNDFLSWFNQTYHSNFQVICEPNPPEAIVQSARTTRWIEVSTAFWTEDYAKDIFSYATPGEHHKPIDPGPYFSMDEHFVENFVSVIKKKLEKKSYVPWRDRYGPGYLIIPTFHPWFERQVVDLMKHAWEECSCNDLGCFRSIFIAFRSYGENKFMRWPLRLRRLSRQ